MKLSSLLSITFVLLIAVSCDGNEKNTATLKIKEPKVHVENKEKEKRDYEEKLKQEKSQREEAQKEKNIKRCLKHLRVM